jgi:hypothetical protein
MSKSKGTAPFPGAKGSTGQPAGTVPARPRPPAAVPRIAVRTRASPKGR